MKPGKPLGRRTQLARGDSPLSRSTPLTAHTDLSRSPSLPRAPFRVGRGGGETPRSRGSEVGRDVRANVYERDGHACVRCGKAVGPGSRQLQHRVARGMGGRKEHDKPSNLITVCGAISTDPASCHYFMESQPLQAQAGGWVVPWGSTSLTMPVLYADGVRYLLDDEGGRRPYEVAS